MWSLLKAFPFPVSLPIRGEVQEDSVPPLLEMRVWMERELLASSNQAPQLFLRTKKKQEKKKKQHSYPVNWTAFIFKNSTYPLWVGERKGLLSPSKLWKENTAAPARFLSCSTSIAPKLSEGVPGSWRCKINWNLVHEKTKCSPYSFITIYFAFF